MNPCDSAEHTLKGYDSSPDYDGFWLERDYRKDAAAFRASTLVVHGWQDYNVKQSEGVDLYEALPLPTTASATAPFKRLYLFQGAHQSPSGRPHFDALLDEFLDTALRGAPPGPELAAPVLTQGRTAAGPGDFRSEDAWPPPAGTVQRLALGRGLAGGTIGGPSGGPAASFTDLGTTTEETALRAPAAELSWLWYQSAPLATGTRIAGTPRLELSLTADQDHGHLTPTLVDLAPDGSAEAISRGFLNLRYRNGLRDDEAVPPGQPVTATVTFSPQDHTVVKGHRIGLVLAGSNTVWAVPDTPAGTTTTVRAGTLVLPTAP
jgi:X-Pro dipeptidyl-peptidase